MKRTGLSPTTQSLVDNPDQEQAKKQKLGIFSTLTQGIVNLIKLPSLRTAKYLQTGHQHAEATDEIFSNASDTLDDEQMESTSGMQMLEFDKEATCGTNTHAHEEMVPNYSKVMSCLRHDCSARKNSKTNHNSLPDDLPPWRLATHRHLLDVPTLDTGRYLKKPHRTVEEAIQKEEREKYKQLLEQEKEKSPKNHSTIAKHSNVQGYGSQKTGHCLETDAPLFEMLRNSIGNFDPFCSRGDINSSMTVEERSLEAEKLVVQKKERAKQPLTNDLSEEVSLKLSLSPEVSSCRRHSLIKTENQNCWSLEKTTECLPALTKDMEREIASALSCGQEDELLSSAFKLKITRGDIRTLRNQQWLNDVVINFYMNLLVERNKRSELPVLYAFSTFFYPKLNSEGYNAVRRWTKEVDLFQYDIVLVPIHVRVHWGLVVVDVRRKTIKYFDSMGQNGYMICKRLLQYLQEESKAKKNLDIDASSWTLYSVKPHEIPQQLNGSDCGMFACRYADYISRDKPITFTQHHMPYFRKRMVWEILHQQLL
ncbi:sentrin-specific protease 2 isoform X2 [Hemicordylus capensis]|uniref:sentrin-specific protease 2 isoform X2 n=1 Tax=Hemicordylus capensis TaxID=884348 RepID=UPI002302BFB3|nr:sentrin-specific protease 2 isoform X2 [Hemicordylus capensis]XP_053167941.1 sentrin-specific protease 2 isoform X2 [Hemicordylus capensis]